MMIKTKLQVDSVLRISDYVPESYGDDDKTITIKYNVEVTFQLQSSNEVTEKKLTTSLNDGLDSFYERYHQTKFDKGDLASFIASYLHNEYRVFLKRVITVKVFNIKLPAVIIETY